MKKYIISALLALTSSQMLPATPDCFFKKETMSSILNEESVFNEDSVSKADSTPTLSKRELRRQRVAKRNLHYNILGGPSYTPDFGLLVGGSALLSG